MIDVKLIDKAKTKSAIIEEIDSSWRDYARRLKTEIFAVPFKGDYRCCVKNNFFRIEGYCGPLVIDKLYDGSNTYLLKTPIKHEPFIIYGEYDQNGEFRDFVSDPEIGCHYLAMNNADFGRTICTGEIKIDDSSAKSLEALKATACEIIKSFRLINLTSLGTVILPKKYSALKDILSDKSKNPEAKTKNLLDADLIEPFFK